MCFHGTYAPCDEGGIGCSALLVKMGSGRKHGCGRYWMGFDWSVCGWMMQLGGIIGKRWCVWYLLVRRKPGNVDILRPSVVAEEVGNSDTHYCMPP